MTNLNQLYLLALITILAASCNQKAPTTFQLLPASKTNITFSNTITESDSFNILVKEFVYNGGGVGIGDLNGDGLEDLIFTGNQVENALYLNKGNLKFEEITAVANVKKKSPQQWSSGVNILDLNLDGKLDIYICNTLAADAELRKNLLFINQGNNETGVPTFKEMAAEYGVDDASHSSHAQFFDYDNDGDVDLFIGVNWIEREYPNRFVELTDDGSAPNRDNLFQNNWNDALGHPVFVDVSLEAGIVHDGYSHSTLIHDFNEDGWQDIYVANDYQSNDLIFINNQDGTFSNEASKIFKHFSLSAMGSDVTDFNNDGAADFVVSEMQPYYNKRKKLFQGGSSYQSQQFTEQYDYDYQYPRNTLQLNAGTNPETGLPIFSEIGMYAQVQETDWSWATLFADYDNDGWKDLYIANGFPKDVTDRDFSDFRSSMGNIADQDQLLAAIPAVKSPNFLFKNQGDLTFENVTASFGLDYPSFSNGAAYGDLDNDGDLDLVVNNIDDPAFVFENTINSNEIIDNNYLRIKLKGNSKNPDAFGSTVEIFTKDGPQKAYLISGRGYLSKSENTLHFGLDSLKTVNKVVVNWADGKQSALTNVEVNQVLTVDYATAKPVSKSSAANQALFQEAAQQFNLNYTNEERDYVDFNFQRTLPHKFSQYQPSIAVADVSGDGLDDIFIGGSSTYEATWFIQTTSGQFTKQSVNYKKHELLAEEDTGSLLFDADGDGDYDLYLVRGSAQFEAGNPLYQDVLLLNDGKGNFSIAQDALPQMYSNGSCVKAADFDGDGDLDLVVGGSVQPRGYPFADRTFLLKNEAGKFIDVTETQAPGLMDVGIVSDAIWTDFNDDHQPDLIVASKWQPLQFFQNENGNLVDITNKTNLDNYKGWWNSLAAGDFDNDGDMDYLAGNFGENLYYRCTADEPIRVYGKDLDDNGMIDPLISCYWQDSLGNKDEYLYHPRADLVKQFVGIRKKFNTHGEYGEATVQEMFTEEEMAGALILEANFMQSVLIENQGNGQFQLHALPKSAQFAPVYGILPYDVNGDQLLDVLLIGNDFGVEVQQGRADAFNGLVLLNQGDFSFDVLSLEESHFNVAGAGIGVVEAIINEQSVILATQNREELKVFQSNQEKATNFIPLAANEVKAILYFNSGKRQETFYWGSGFMSQRSRHIEVNSNVQKIEFLDGTGNITRVLEGQGLLQ